MTRHTYYRWTAADIATLRAMYPDHRCEAVAAAIGCTMSAVYQRARALGLGKSDAFNASDISGRIQRGRTDPRMVATQIKPGTVPWNKGIKGVVGVQAACRAQHFKPGHQPHNTHAVGAYRINKDGHLQQKVSAAKVEVEYIKAIDATHSDFLAPKPTDSGLPPPSDTPTAHRPFPVSKRHRLEV